MEYRNFKCSIITKSGHATEKTGITHRKCQQGFSLLKQILESFSQRNYVYTCIIPYIKNQPAQYTSGNVRI